MSVAPGTRFGPYEVVALLGAGGMGEVYRARDTRLDRAVAVKVLPAAAAGDSAFRNRLHTEARAISQLSHPHICTLHDIGEQDGTTFLVMELIQGETLADRLKKHEGRGLPIAEALRLAAQIADALAAAHRQGITHRDLKPGNVMLTRGRARAGEPDVKLLDFGLARIGQQPAASSEESRVLTEAPQTASGSLLGTFQYMAPEQIEGARGDARSDVFAFGCVLYEMLTGRRAFDGKSSAAIMAAILEREPASLVTLDPQIPPLVASLVEKCLAKSPEDRWQSAADLGTALRWIAAAPPGKHPGAEATTVPHRPSVEIGRPRYRAHASCPRDRRCVGRGATSSRPPSPPAESRFEISPPPGTTWSPSPVASTAQLALSPDGRQLAFVAAPAREAPRIWIRALNSLQARPLEGTDDAAFPFWSPDSRFIAFFAGGKLKKISTAGGTPQVLADAALGSGGSWSRDDVILFTPNPNHRHLACPSRRRSCRRRCHRIGADRAATRTSIRSFLPMAGASSTTRAATSRELQGIYVRDARLRRIDAQSPGTTVWPCTRLGICYWFATGRLFAQPVDDATMRDAR